MSNSCDDSSLADISDVEDADHQQSRPQSENTDYQQQLNGRTSIPPIRTGQNTPICELGSESVANNNAPDNFNKREPLPPIGQSTPVIEAHSDPDDDPLPSDESSEELDNVDNGQLYYTEDGNKGTSQRHSTRDTASISSKPPPSGRRSKASVSAPSPAVREVTTRLDNEGRQIEMISIDIQTEINMAATPDVVESIKTEIKGVARPLVSRSSSGQIAAPGLFVDDKDKTADSANEDMMTAAETSSMPWPPRDDEFGVPLLALSSDSESSDDEGDGADYTREDELRMGTAYNDTLPSVGPPEILKYIRESDRVDVDPSNASLTKGESCVSIMGVCEFCKQPIKPFPTLEQQEALPPEDLYCCEEYRNFVHFALNIPTDGMIKQDYKIDIKPHAHYGSKQARRIAKERATMSQASSLIDFEEEFNLAKQERIHLRKMRLRERELMRQQQAVAAGMPTQQSAFYQFAKQMKTINYQLSSQKCQDEGWTVRVPTPPQPREQEPTAFEIEPMDWPIPEEEEPTDESLAYDALGRRILVRNIIERFYDNGNKFLTVFPDGTGHVFYPSGNLAITISSTLKGQFRYVIQDDTSNDRKQSVLAMFEPSGIGTCNYKKGNKPRLYYDQMGGVELDIEGARKKKWYWREKAHHVHAPPFQPICMSLNKYISLRVMTQENIAMQFMTKKRSCRFNVGVRLKLVNAKYLPIEEIDDNKLFINEKLATIEAMMNKIANMLRYPNSSKVTKIKPPLYLTSKVERNEKMQEKLKQQREETVQRQKNANCKPIVSVT